MNAAENTSSAPPDWRRRTLDLVSTAQALGTVAAVALASRQAILAESPGYASIVYAVTACTLAIAVWRSGPYVTRGVALTLVLFLSLALLTLRAGYAPETIVLALSAAILPGLLFGVRPAIAGWILSIAVLGLGGAAISNGLVPFPNDPPPFAPLAPEVLRTLLIYTTASGILAIGTAVLVNRLAASLDETQRAETLARESDLRWRSLVRNVEDLIVISNRDHRTIFRNHSKLGFAEDAVLGSRPEDFVTPPHRPALERAIEHVFETGERTGLEVSSQDPNGRIFRFQTEVSPIFRDERVDQVALVCRDVTAQRDLEEQLRQAQKLEAVGQLTGGVAHDFNNLLTVILGHLELATEELKETSDAWESMQQATEAARRAADLTQRLLAFSRKQALRPEMLDLNELVDGMDPMLRRTLGAQVEIETIREEALWECEADPSQIESLILNLGINARDAMSGGGRLSIETGNCRLGEEYASRCEDVQPGEYVRLAVRDTGEGMTPAVVERAFDPFFTTKDVGRGTGLGLSMVYGFVKQSGGHVTIQSAKDEGTTVTVYLPRARALHCDSRAAPAGTDLPQGDGETVLVVEDEPGVRSLAVRLLVQLGYRTREAAEAGAALRILEDDPSVALLFTDVVLPGDVNGSALATEALRRHPDLRVLFTSGYTEESITDHGRLLPGVELLEKPFLKQDLARRVHAALAVGTDAR